MPGLIFRGGDYRKIILSGVTYEEIPVSDWLPPDFEDVLVKTKDKISIKCYYSPARNMMLRSECDLPLDISHAECWLRECK